jgi:hypothetical protein
MNLSTIEKELKKVKDQKNNWKRISYLLNYCQQTKAFNSEYEKYTHWIESLNPKMGLNRSTLIRIKSAGEFWIQLTGKRNLNAIEDCQIEDSRIFTDYKTLLNKVEKGILSISSQKLTAIKNKILSEKVSRGEITDLLNDKSETREIKDNILKLKKFGKNNERVQELLRELEEELVA